jgi:hypothetical protein
VTWKKGGGEFLDFFASEEADVVLGRDTSALNQVMYRVASIYRPTRNGLGSKLLPSISDSLHQRRVPWCQSFEIILCKSITVHYYLQWRIPTFDHLGFER